MKLLIARVVMIDLLWVTFELRIKKKKSSLYGKLGGRASQVQRAVSTKAQNQREAEKNLAHSRS